MAREQFDSERPSDAPRLPLSYSERERVKCGGISTIVALYARSLENRNYDLEEPPSFYDYACGVLASEHNGYASLQNNEELRKRFPPRRLAGLGPGLYWEPPAEHERMMASYRRSLQGAAA
jgi:hypothetical protein